MIHRDSDRDQNRDREIKRMVLSVHIRHQDSPCAKRLVVRLTKKFLIIYHHKKKSA